MRYKERGSDGTFGTAKDPEDRIRRLRTGIAAIRDEHRLPLDAIAEQSGVTRKTLARFLDARREGAPREYTLTQLEKFVEGTERKTGFVGKDTYLAIADGMGAELDNADFLSAFGGEYRVLRAHVPSKRPLISTLTIFGDTDQRVIRYKQVHVVSDALSLFATERKSTEIVYEGFVFNCHRRAFLMSTSRNTGHVKEIILSMPATGKLSETSIRGLLLTVSADERQPFAARLLVQKIPLGLSKADSEKWEPGLKQWADFPDDLRAEFGPQANYGLLHLHA
jgi:transcriptional regulator with XRE-family HTH domain